ncbi:unnamed protein product [Adineta steineri]|uniref:Aspartyl protease n=1 Tax=Adineta steineri TaxID=433720 RepID=A0A818P638_9BILA|nr:unnamed protein product [Adineta steineri]CAF3616025.1 unnamed protein product [Adineta steineri]
MSTFAIKFLDGHIIVNLNQFDYVIDTGSPMSFGRGTNIIINGKSFSIPNADISGLTADSLSKLSGLKIDGLIGMNILMHFDIRFTRTHITFSNTPFLHADTAIKLPIIDMIMTIPIITLKIENTDHRLYFDTGAKISYLSDDLLIGTSIGEMDDFHPQIGTYKTNVYKINVNINGNVETLTFGSLPASLRMLLTMGRAKGILGTELLNKYSIILSNLNKVLVLELAGEETSFDQHQNSTIDELSLD